MVNLILLYDLFFVCFNGKTKKKKEKQRKMK